MATVISIIHMALDMQYSMYYIYSVYIYIVYIYSLYIYIHKTLYICIYIYAYIYFHTFISERYHSNLIVSDSVYFVSRGGFAVVTPAKPVMFRVHLLIRP